MSTLSINDEPKLTRELVRLGVFREQPLFVVDVGARGGIADYWKVFGDDIRVVGFELDASECERLNRLDSRVLYLPYALDEMARTRRVFVADHSSSTSFYKNEVDFMDRFVGQRENLRVLEEIDVETVTLAGALERHGLGSPDFIKLDAEGAELDILKGATPLLPQVLGLLTEMRFSTRLNGSPPFWQVDAQLREWGFDLFDLDIYRLARAALSYPFLYSNFDEGRPVAGPTVQGQLCWADGLYFRDLFHGTAPLRQLHALVCLYEIFGMNDCAAELILANQEMFSALADVDGLLDLLVPQHKTTRLTYRALKQRDFLTDPLFRPTYHNKYPQAHTKNFDGTFVPRWATFGVRLRTALHLIFGSFR